MSYQIMDLPETSPAPPNPFRNPPSRSSPPAAIYRDDGAHSRARRVLAGGALARSVAFGGWYRRFVLSESLEGSQRSWSPWVALSWSSPWGDDQGKPAAAAASGRSTVALYESTYERTWEQVQVRVSIKERANGWLVGWLADRDRNIIPLPVCTTRTRPAAVMTSRGVSTAARMLFRIDISSYMCAIYGPDEWKGGRETKSESRATRPQPVIANAFFTYRGPFGILGSVQASRSAPRSTHSTPSGRLRTRSIGLRPSEELRSWLSTLLS